MHMAGELKPDTQLIKLRNLKFQHCEGNYSKASHACTWPCAITERDPEDQLAAVYEGLVHWADVVIISTPIRWGNASALYYKLAVFPPFPFIAHSRGWDAEDMHNNVRQVQASEALREAARELVERALDFWKILEQNHALMEKPMERAGRKASPLANPAEAIV